MHNQQLKPITDQFSCVCKAGYTNGICDDDYISQYEAACHQHHSSACDVDVNECDSHPCNNGATCVESNSDNDFVVNAYTCVCTAGYTSGVPGNCEIDVDECTSTPCKNGAECTDSNDDDQISINAYECTCGKGFGNGICNFTPLNGYEASKGYCDKSCVDTDDCTCSVDVDECSSRPCLKGGRCTDSTNHEHYFALPLNFGAYFCACARGYTGDNCAQDTDECAETPCRNNAICYDSSTSSMVSAGQFSCVCTHGYQGIICDVDVDECASQPCKNGGTCVESRTLGLTSPVKLGEYACQCWAGSTGADCSIDVDECASGPCDNSATCVANSILAGLSWDDLLALSPGDAWKREHALQHNMLNAYSCLCAAGFANGMCNYASAVHVNAASCTVSTGGNCDADVNECESGPCKNNAQCTDSSTTSPASLLYDMYACACTVGYTGSNCDVDVDECEDGPCGQHGTCTESSTDASVAIGTYSCLCQAGYDSKNCDVDVDECESNPCANGGVCSTTDATVGANTYRCSCLPGYANGLCAGASLALPECRVSTDGNCDLIVDGCFSSPCDNGATCIPAGQGAYTCSCVPGFQSTRCEVDVDECASKPSPCANSATCREYEVNSYRCTCAAGYTSGWCEYNYIAEVSAQCRQGSGECGIDVDECASSPCQNGATCSDSTDPAPAPTYHRVSVHAYRCTCVAGFANGLCLYTSKLQEYATECSVLESSSYGGNCDMDVDECRSSPCQNGATCQSGEIELYSCTCVAGYSNGLCGFTPQQGYEVGMCANSSGNCNNDVDECSSTPCLNGGICSTASAAAYSCACVSGAYAGANCEVEVNACSSNPCRNGGLCHRGVDTATKAATWTCTCALQERDCNGRREPWTGESCDKAPTPCSHSQRTCHEQATCSRVDAKHHTCTCHFGWEGDGSTCTDYNECSSNPCLDQHGSSCRDSSVTASVPVGAYTCICAAGWADGGCALGWDGEAATRQRYTNLCIVSLGGHCNVDMDECHSKPCQNGGLCTESNTDNTTQIDAFACSCEDTGYEGDVCDAPVNMCTMVPCNNYGVCSSIAGRFACACSPGFSGNVCDVDERVDECKTAPCTNGGTCSTCTNSVHGTESCSEYNAEQGKPAPTVVYAGHTCACVSGYAGTDCATDIDECDTTPCHNGATCASSGLQFSCTCAAGYTNGICSDVHMKEYADECFSESHGEAPFRQLCDIDMDECSSTPCQSGGTCTTTTTPDAYKCTCVDGWTGHDCEVDVNECETDQSACSTSHGSVCTDSSVVPRTPSHEGRFWQIRAMGPSLGGVQRMWAWCVSAA